MTGPDAYKIIYLRNQLLLRWTYRPGKMQEDGRQMQVTDFDAQERRNWAGQAEAYRKSYAKVCAGAVTHLIDSADVRSGIQVLDVGTGSGTVAAAAAALGAEVTAVDADPDMVALATGLVPGAEFHVAALPAFPFENDQFDAVLANFVINHVGKPHLALTELRRVTVPGGRIAVTIWPQPPSPAIALLTRAIRDCGVERPSQRLAPADDFPRTEAGLRDLLANAGLRNTTCQLISWQLEVKHDTWWRIASGASWMRMFKASQTSELLDRVRNKFDQLSREYLAQDGQLSLPITALLARGEA
jgi:SAM-dependent methyltransferase